MSGFAAIEDAAVERFLQTALIVDDRMSAAREPEAGPATEEDVNAPQAPPLGSRGGAAREQGGGAKAQPPGGTPSNYIDLKKLGDSFADLGLTLGVLNPSGGDSPGDVTERIARAGANVDILVIDWYLDSAEKFTAEEPLRRLVEAGRNGRHLIAIYTTYRQLEDIATDIAGIDGVERGNEGAMTFRAGATQIVLYNKGGTDVDEDLRRYVVPAGELGARLKSDFRDLVGGWVPAVTLNAVAATRENTHRLLDRLAERLDLGYGAHVMRTGDTADAAAHLLTAISGEFRAIIEDDEGSRDAAGRGAFERWLEQRENEESLGRPAADILRELEALPRPIKRGRDLAPAGGEAEARCSNEALAMVLSLRHRYGEPAPKLTLGTIVVDARPEPGYWLCLQPVCDAVRIKGQRGFPFLPLEAPLDEENARFHHVVPGPDGNPLRLYRPSEPYEISMVVIEAGDDETVTFSLEDDELRAVETADGNHLSWVAQLKPVHAQRVAEEVGSQLSRVGLDESEWLRMRAGPEKKIAGRRWE